MAVVFLAGFGTLDAQTTVRVAPGHLVRVQHQMPSGAFGRGFRGTVEHLVGDTVLVIRTADADQLIHVRATDYRVRVLAFNGRRSSIVPGAVVGALLGAAAGGVIGLGFADPCPPPENTNAPTCIEGGPEALEGAAIGLGGGLVLGVALGSLVKRDRWSPVHGFPPAQPLLFNPRGGPGFGLSFRW